MSAVCDAAIHLCAIRITRLDQLGNLAPGPNNVYVSGNPMMLSVKPNVEAGQDKTLVGGCDCIIATYRGFDKLKRFDLELDLGVQEPGLMEMMLGAPAILNAGLPIGIHWPSQVSCSDPVQPNVCIEAWQDLWDDDHQANDFPYVHYIFPGSHWTVSDFSLQNDFNQPKLTGYTRGNPEWGTGPYGDTPEAVGPLGSWWYTTTAPPAGVCGYQTHNLT